MNILTDTSPAIAAAKQLNQVLAMYTGRPVLLMLSGGSALTILDHLDISLFGPHVTITTLDERFSTDRTVNNFAQITATNFYKGVLTQGAQTISTIIEADETLSEAGERFDTALHYWRDSNKDGVVIATMGVGADGHTAGIFPHQPSLDPETTNWVAPYEVPPEINPYTKRITVTPVFLKTQVTEAICLITGEEKRNVLAKIKNGDCPTTDTPACIMRDMLSMIVITDLD